MGLIPKKTKQATKVFKGLTAQRFLGLFLVIMISAMVGNIIGGWIKFIFMIFCIIVYFIASGKSPTNPNQIFIKGLMQFISFKFDNKEFYGTCNDDVKTYLKNKEQRMEKKNAKKTKRAKKVKY